MESAARGALYPPTVEAEHERAGARHDASAATARAPAKAIATVLVGALAISLVVGIRGEFPLSDDWSYAFATRSLCEEGHLRLLPWTGASLVLQAWYGAALCSIFGFSFAVLRASTVALAVSGAIASLLLLRALGVRGRALALGTSVVALNPLYVNLSFSFMTDVPFAVAALWAGYGYVRALQRRSVSLLAAGSLLASAAILIRQHGIFIALAAALAAGLATDRPARERLRGAAAAIALPAVTFVAFHVWLFFLHGAPSGYTNKIGEARGVHLAGAVNCAFRGLEYLGLLLSPIVVSLSPRSAGRRIATVAAVVLLTALAVLLYLREGALMFYLSNVLYDLGVGPLSLRDTLFLGQLPPLHVGPLLQVPLTAIATLATGALVVAWVCACVRRQAPERAFVAFCSALLFAGTLLHTRYYFDRYLLVVIPFLVAAVLLDAPPGRREGLGIALAAVLAWYSVAGTHDYLAWNRARWSALDALSAAGVPATEIDGGLEFNAWHLAAELDRWPSDEEARRGQSESRRSWWWVVDDRFVVAFRPLAGYTVRADVPFARWLVPGRGHVLMLERAH